MKTSNQDVGCGSVMPPTFQHVNIYFQQRGISEKGAKGFYYFYKSRKWRTDKGCPITNWKVAANNWIYQYQQNKPVSISIKIKLMLEQQNQHFHGRHNPKTK